MTKLCPRGKAAAKRKFKVYPSAYANAYASKICAGKIKDPSGVKRKDFKGRKPAAEGGKIKGGPAGLNPKTREKLLEKNRGPRKFKPGLEKVSPEMNAKLNEQRRRELSLIKAKPPKSGSRSKPRPKMMGGGLMEATQRLRRQGLRKGGGVCLRGMNRDAIGKNS